jgi:hypothetical protein
VPVPGVTVCELGDPEIEKSWTVSMTGVLWFTLPLIPVIVMV